VALGDQLHATVDHVGELQVLVLVGEDALGGRQLRAPDDDADHFLEPGTQGAGGTVGDEPEFGDGLHDPVLGLHAWVALPIQHPRHRRDRHASRSRHVVDRGRRQCRLTADIGRHSVLLSGRVSAYLDHRPRPAMAFTSPAWQRGKRLPERCQELKSGWIETQRVKSALLRNRDVLISRFGPLGRVCEVREPACRAPLVAPARGRPETGRPVMQARRPAGAGCRVALRAANGFADASAGLPDRGAGAGRETERQQIAERGPAFCRLRNGRETYRKRGHGKYRWY
jgi:hypothetical protein